MEYYPSCGVLFEYDINSDEQLNNMTNKIFSMFNDSLPFVKTGSTIGYRDDGHYPSVPKYIQDMKDIVNIKEIIDNDNKTGDEIYFTICIDHKGQYEKLTLVSPC